MLKIRPSSRSFLSLWSAIGFAIRNIFGLLAPVTIILITIFLSNCNDEDGINGGDIDPSGIWIKQNNPAFSLIIGRLESQPGNRVLFCDESLTGIGCALGTLNNENTIILDDETYPVLSIELSNDIIYISPKSGVSQTFTGNFEQTKWNDGNCGLYINENDHIGPLDNNCIVGEWYTLVRNPFGNQSDVIYKNYFRGGDGELINPDENITITFEWFTTDDNSGDIIHEINFSDGRPDKVYAYICTEEGLTLGTGGSWIRRNLQCLF